MNIQTVFCLLAISVSLVGPVSIKAATKTMAVPAEQNESRQAMAALRLLLSAYASGNPSEMETLIDPGMIGYSGVLDAVRQAGSTQRQLRLSLSDTRMQLSDDTVLIQTRWEKRFVRLPARVAVRKTGAATFIMQRSDGRWKLSALSGENPFANDQ
jgi:hypothetical protein